MADAKRDSNRISTLLAVSNVDGITPVALWADPITHRLLVDIPASGGVTGPGSSVDGNVAVFDGTTGGKIKDGGTLGTNAFTSTSYVPFTGASTDLDLNAKVLKNFFISKVADATAKMTFDVSALSTATTRTLTVRDSSGTIALTSDLSTYAPLNSPSFTGIPSLPTGTTATTQSANDNSTKLATTAYTDAKDSATLTLTNKRITQRVISATSYTTDTGTSLNADNCDVFRVTAQAGALLFNSPGGTPTDGQKLIISVASSTTAARALTWNAIFEASTIALPTTTAATTAQLNIGFIYSTPRTKWVCVAVS